MIQPGNWRGNVMQVAHHRTVPAKPTGTGPERVLAKMPPEPVPDRNRNSGRFLI